VSSEIGERRIALHDLLDQLLARAHGIRHLPDARFVGVDAGIADDHRVSAVAGAANEMTSTKVKVAPEWAS